MTYRPRHAPPHHLAGVALLCLALAGCSETLVDPPKPAATPPVLARAVRLSADTAQLLVGDTTTLAATVADSRGATIQNAPVVWTSSDPTVLSSAGSGRFVAIAPGFAIVVATAQGVSATARITVIEVQRRDAVISSDTSFTVLSTPEEIAAGTLRMRANSGTARPVAVGDVVFGSKDGGFLEKVMAVRTSGQDLVLTTVPAALTDAIQEGTISIAEDIDVGAALAEARARGESAAFALPRGVSIDAEGNVVFQNAALDFTMAGQVGPITASVRLNGSLDIKTGKDIKPGTNSFVFDVAIKPCFPVLVCVDNMRFGTVVGAVLNGTLETSIGGALSARGGLPLVKIPVARKKLLNIPIRGQCLAGKLFCYGLFVVLEAYAEVEANAQLTISRSLSMTSGVDAGFRFTPSTGFKGTFTPISQWTQSSPVYSIGGQAGIRFGLEPKLLLTVFGRGELSAGVDAALQATIGTSIGAGANYDWNARVDALVDAFARASVDVLGIKASYETRLRLWDTQLAGANGSLVTLSLSPFVLSLAEQATGTVVATARTVLGGIDIGITPDQLDWTATPSSVATVSATGVVTAIAPGLAKVKATIKGTTISHEVNVSVTPRALSVEACFYRGVTSTQQPPGGRCPVPGTTPQFVRGTTTHYLWVKVFQSSGAVETGTSVTARNPFTNAVVSPLGLVGTFAAFEFAVPSGAALGRHTVVVGPATKAGFASSAPINVTLDVILGHLAVGACLSKDGGTTFNPAVHCPSGTPTGTAGQTFYLWFGADFNSTALCGASLTIDNPFTGAPTNHVVPAGTPGCLSRLAIPVPAGTPPRDYTMRVGPARLAGYGDGAPLTLTVRVQ